MVCISNGLYMLLPDFIRSKTISFPYVIAIHKLVEKNLFMQVPAVIALSRDVGQTAKEIM